MVGYQGKKNAARKTGRARSEDAREARRAVIVAAATQIVDKGGFTSLTMDAVAKRSKLAKASLYGYFQTREDLLLCIFQNDFQAWFQGFRGYLQQSDAPFSDSVAQVWTAGIMAQPRVPMGLLYLHTQLESNISEEFVRSSKFFLFRELKETHYQLIARFQPIVSLKELAHLFISLSSVTIGLWAQSQSNEIVHSVYRKEPELGILKVDLPYFIFERQKWLQLLGKFNRMFWV